MCHLATPSGVLRLVKKLEAYGATRAQAALDATPRLIRAENSRLTAVIETIASDLAMVPRLVLTLLLTGLLGWERERKERPAGLRTHMLVGISACSFVLLGELFLTRFGQHDGGTLQFDPIRIIEATVAGVSFLGAGTIFVRGSRHVYGLTTAGSLLAAAAVAMMVAVEHYALAVITTLLILLVVAGLQRLEACAHQQTEGAPSAESAHEHSAHEHSADGHSADHRETSATPRDRD